MRGRLEVVQCITEHVAEVHAREELAGAANYILSGGLAIDMEHAVTLLEDGIPIACGGVVPLWDGVGGAWAVISESATKYPVRMVRVPRVTLARAEAERGYKRIQMTVCEELDRKTSEWPKSLGFELEGVMRNYGVGGVGNHFMYSRTS